MANSIFEAIEDRNIPQFKAEIIIHPELIDVPNASGCTPLLEACKVQSEEMVEFLLTFGSQAILTPDKNGSLPIHWIAQKGNLNILQRLLDAAPIPAKEHALRLNVWNRTSFWYACCINENQDVVRFLFDLVPEALHIIPKDIDPNGEGAIIYSDHGPSIVLDMIQGARRNLDLVLKLGRDIFGTEWIHQSIDEALSAPKIVPRTNATIETLDPQVIAVCSRTKRRIKPKRFFFLAARCQSTILFDLLLQRFPDGIEYLDRDGESLSHYMAMGDGDEILNYFLKTGRQASGPKWLISALLQVGTNYLGNDCRCLFLKAIGRDYLPIRQVIYDYLDEILTSSVYDEIREPLRDAILGKGNAGMNTDNFTDVGLNLLHVSSYDRVMETIPILVKWGGSDALHHALTRLNTRGATPVHINLEAGQLKTVEFLIWLGSELNDVEATSQRGKISIFKLAIFCKLSYANTINRVIFLRALGCIYDSKYQDIYSNMNIASQVEASLTRDLDENEVMVIRHRVYFERSLTERLLYFLP